MCSWLIDEGLSAVFLADRDHLLVWIRTGDTLLIQVVLLGSDHISHGHCSLA